ncbi:uncharacterized protein LOC112548294 [Alligator sinensis]|uniref:Uncharacterized protein LOC112548294 n=1 Tax=Alligator sinensis TaxID=38654 RepID=A0A3Q0FQ69_ALLSI|nr:uncharacterized protein LOC112548294 [Alligator sinensis]
MSEHVLTYSDVKFDRSKKKKPGNKVIQKEMTAYSELKFQNLPEQQRSTRAQQTERRGPWGSPSPRRRNKDPSATPLQRQLATLVLGILCLILLIATGVLGYNVVQLGIERNSFHEQVGYLSSELTSCQNQGVPGSVQELPHDIGEKCPARWSHSTSRSYLFSPEKRPWDQCKYSCSSHSASLIMMESREDWGLKQWEQGKCTFLCSTAHHPLLVNSEEKEKHNGPDLVLVSELLGLQWNDADGHQQRVRPVCVKEPHP